MIIIIIIIVSFTLTTIVVEYGNQLKYFLLFPSEVKARVK